MKHIRLTTKYLSLLFLVLILLGTALFPIGLEGGYFSLMYHSTSDLNAGDDPGFYYSAASLSYNSIFTEPVTPVTIHFGCQQTPLREESVYDHLRVKEEQLRRRKHLREVCTSEPGSSRIVEINRKHFLVDRNRHILYCWIHKVASTSWISFFAQLRGLRVRTKRIYREIGRLSASSQDEVKSAGVDYRIRFLVVRHPFRRLISAYRDRIWAAKHKYSAQALSHVPRIFRLTRPNLFQLKSSLSIIHNNSRILAMVPTFEEFVRYLLAAADANYSNEFYHNISSKTAFDVHWAPYHQHCSVCSIPFNIIIKLETIEDDKNYLMEEIGLAPHKMTDTQSMMDTNMEFSKKNERRKAATSKNDVNINIPFSNLSLKESDKITELYQATPHMTMNKLKFKYKSKNKISVTEESQAMSTNLDHLQVSSIGPSCPCYYFSQLTIEQIHGLTKIYERDLKIFGYDTEEYYSCLTH